MLFFIIFRQKIDTDPLAFHSNPESSFYVIKNAQQSSSSFPSANSNTLRAGNARTLFTVIPPMPQDIVARPHTSQQRLLIKGGRVV
ncbi:unnamed protein product, partial [Adineta steineri]